MNKVFKFVFAATAFPVVSLVIDLGSAAADIVPDALSVEWQGKKPCEKLYEDTQLRILRCTFPPGSVHVCHSHPAYIGYFLTGGHAEIADQNGKRTTDVASGARVFPPISWHEFANVGDTTMQALVIEKKYEPAPAANQTVCPTRSQ